MTSPPPSAEPASASRQIDAMIAATPGWRGTTLARLRAAIREADPAVVEEVKWRRPSNPAGVPVWSHAGIVCVANVLKRAVRLTFPSGAQMMDPRRLFNARMDSGTVRAIDVHEDAGVDPAALRALIRQAVKLNTARAGRG